MIDAFETFAAIAHIVLGVLIGVGIVRKESRWWSWGLVALLTIVEGIRFVVMGPS